MKSLFAVIFFLPPFLLLGQFKEQSKERGIDHVHATQTTMGGGAAWFDYNNDGFLDLYATDADRHDHLYENLGDGTFLDVSVQTGITDITWGIYTFSVIVGDVNNDGCDDLFVTTYDPENSNLMLLNNCDGTFSNISNSAGITHKMYSSGSTFIDFNQDGFLDIYVINYIDKFTFIKDENDIIIDIEKQCLPDLFYINEGNNTFKEMSEDYGINNSGCGLAVVSSDYDQDGDQDIYVVNDHGMDVVPNTLYRNNYPQNSFSDNSENSGLNVPLFGMGVAPGDYNEDGIVDFYVSNLGNNALMTGDLNNNYTDMAIELGIQNGHYEDSVNVTGWGTFFFDFDNDMDLDLFVSNGYIRTGYFGFETTQFDKNKLFVSNGDNTFIDKSEEYDLNNSWIGRGASYADFDRDGDLDFFVVNTSAISGVHSLLYVNETSDSNWLQFDLEGSKNTNRNAFGSSVTIYIGAKDIRRELVSGGSFASQHSQLLHFGLGENTVVDSVRVKWTNGASQMFYDVASNHIYHLKQGELSLEISGCTDPESLTYDPLATFSSACHKELVYGCTNPTASNYDSRAKLDDGSCNFTSNIITGLEQVDNNELVIFPNPVENQIELRMPEDISTNSKSIYIYDAVGRLQYLCEDWKSDTFVIDASEFSSGILILKILVKDEEVVLSKKLIKN